MNKMIELNFFGTNSRLDHIGLVVKSIIEVCPTCEITVDPIQKVAVSFVVVNGLNIELIEPRGDNSPVASNLDKGNKLLHLCYVVDNLKDAINHARQYGFHRISKQVEAVAFDNRKITWLYSGQYGLVELLER